MGCTGKGLAGNSGSFFLKELILRTSELSLWVVILSEAKNLARIQARPFALLRVTAISESGPLLDFSVAPFVGVHIIR